MSVLTIAQESVQVAGCNVAYVSGGSGEPLVVVHHEIGNPGWLPVYENLAATRRVVVPDLPGYGKSERPAWARDARDLAILTHLLLDRLALAKVDLLGLGFGGWVAAEMATMDQARFGRIVLINPYGLRPRQGEYMDQFLISHEEFVRAGFHDPAAFERQFGELPAIEQLEQWDVHREMTTRLAWKPYMFSHALPALLGEVRRPTLVIAGESDRIAPLDVARQYCERLPLASLEVMPATGHFAEMERPDEVAAHLTRFLAEQGRDS
jgi:pimeloyl-ACP methyl ester carboxylesterase